MKDIPQFLDIFFKENMFEKIPNKAEPEFLYCMYTDYDTQGNYNYFVGTTVTNVDTVPAGLVSKTVPASQYALFKENGAFYEKVPALWQHIWTTSFSFQWAKKADFEKYHLSTFATQSGPFELYLSAK